MEFRLTRTALHTTQRIATLLCCTALLASCASIPGLRQPKAAFTPRATEKLLEAHPEATDLVELIKDTDPDQILNIIYIGGDKPFSHIIFYKDGTRASRHRGITPSAERDVPGDYPPSHFALNIDPSSLEFFFAEAKNQQRLCPDHSTTSTMQSTKTKKILQDHTCTHEKQTQSFIAQQQLPDIPDVFSQDGLDHILNEAQQTVGDRVTSIVLIRKRNSVSVKSNPVTCVPDNQCEATFYREGMISESRYGAGFSTAFGPQQESEDHRSYSIKDLDPEKLWNAITEPPPQLSVGREEFTETISDVRIISKSRGTVKIVVYTNDGKWYANYLHIRR